MKTNAQTKQAIILGVLLLGLIIVVIYTLSSGKKTATAVSPAPNAAASSATAPPNASSTPPTAVTTTASESVDWVDPQRLAGIVNEVKDGRNPFHDTLARSKPLTPVVVKSHGGTLPAAGSPIPGKGELLGGLKKSIIPPFTPPSLPPPAFVLSGIMADHASSYATISIDGQFFTVRAGEVIPRYGWTVVSINTAYNYVSLTKEGSQPVTLRMSGGNQQ